MLCNIFNDTILFYVSMLLNCLILILILAAMRLSNTFIENYFIMILSILFYDTLSNVLFAYTTVMVSFTDSQGSVQLEGFIMFYEYEGSETQLYDNTGVSYGGGVFTIPIVPPVTANAIIIRKTGILTLCEVEINGGENKQYEPRHEKTGFLYMGKQRRR